MAGEKKSKRRKGTVGRTGRTLPSTKFLNEGGPQTSTLLSPLRYALHAGSWLVVQTMLASGGQNEIDVDDGNHAVY